MLVIGNVFEKLSQLLIG